MTDPCPNPVERIAAELQRLPSGVRWLAANMQAVIEEIGTGAARNPGPREKRTRRLLAAANRVGVERILADIASILLLLYAWLSQFRALVQRTNAPLFIGIGALRESELEPRFASLAGGAPLNIDERHLVNFNAHGRVSLGALMWEFAQVRRGVWNGVVPRSPLGPLPWTDVVNFYLLRCWHYVYLRAWFRQYLQRTGAQRPIASVTASNAAYAAIAAGAEVVYMLHGFQRYSLVYPDYARCICFSGFESAHMQRRLPGCVVELDTPHVPRLDTRRVAGVAGIFWEPDGFDRIRPFIAWARQHDLAVVVRKHPFDTSDYWEQWRDVPGIEILEGRGSFEEFLTSVRPRFLASWHSTVLFDSLLRGVVPVTVNADASAALVVYPIEELALRWPQDGRIADSVVDDDRARDALLAKLTAKAMSDTTLPVPEPALA